MIADLTEQDLKMEKHAHEFYGFSGMMDGGEIFVPTDKILSRGDTPARLRMRANSYGNYHGVKFKILIEEAGVTIEQISSGGRISGGDDAAIAARMRDGSARERYGFDDIAVGEMVSINRKDMRKYMDDPKKVSGYLHSYGDYRGKKFKTKAVDGGTRLRVLRIS